MGRHLPSQPDKLIFDLYIVDCPDTTNYLLIWGNDNLSAVYGVKNGNCRPEKGHPGVMLAL